MGLKEPASQSANGGKLFVSISEYISTVARVGLFNARGIHRFHKQGWVTEGSNTPIQIQSKDSKREMLMRDGSVQQTGRRVRRQARSTRIKHKQGTNDASQRENSLQIYKYILCADDIQLVHPQPAPSGA